MLALALDPRPESANYTDLGNAARATKRYGGGLRWVPGRGWISWDGRVWIGDDAKPMRAMVTSLRRTKQEARRALAIFPPGTLKALELGELLDWCEKSEDVARIRAGAELAKVYLAIDPGLLDRNPQILNVRNGVVDLRDGTHRAHHPADLATRLAPVDYDPGAACPMWDTFLDTIFDGNEALIQFVQRLVGYTVLGGTQEQIFVICYGTGANGKSTFIELLHDLLGGYARKTPIDTFMKKSGSGIPNDLARLTAVRLVSAVETDLDRALAEGVVKAISGSDTIMARFLYKEFFEFTPEFTPWIGTNHLPRIRGTDYGIWRRIFIIPFTITIPKEAQDKHLPAKLREELPGILNWVIEGALAYQRIGLAEPVEITRAVADYRKSQDPLGLWISDVCTVDEEVFAATKRLHESYRAWAVENGFEEMSIVEFGRRLRERGLTPARETVDGIRVRGWRGIEVRDLAPRPDLDAEAGDGAKE